MTLYQKLSRRWAAFVVIGLAFFTFFMAAEISRSVFDRLPHLEDELAYLYQARIFANGDLVIETPQPRSAFWQPFVVDYQDTRFGKYSPGWPLYLALGLILGQPWVINAFAAMLTVVLVYRLGREAFNVDVGVVAAALVAFSPMALLLNGTLMSHTTALLCFTLFAFAYWRLSQRDNALAWGVGAGAALGLLVINRPLTAAGLTLPFILWSGGRVILALYAQYISKANPWGMRLRPVLVPLLALSALTLIISAFLPVFTTAATGEPSQNLYTLVWEYDQVGFGTCCGRSSQNGGEGHTIIKGVRHTRFDLSMMAADLFGWQRGVNGSIGEEFEDHLLTRASYLPEHIFGFSFLLLPLGLLIGLRPFWAKLWALLGGLWLVVPMWQDRDFLKDGEILIDVLGNEFPMAWAWVGVFILWSLIPLPILLISRREQETNSTTRWTYLMLAVIISLMCVQLSYWIGSQRYSTRYYFETLAAFALISAIPVAFLARRAGRPLVYGLFAGVLAWGLLSYGLPRINVLEDFNQVSAEYIAEIEARRESDDPLLVIINAPSGTVSWRAYGSLMALTDPYLENEIVAAWNYRPESDLRSELIAQFPGREVIDMWAEGTEYGFLENPPEPVVDEDAPEAPPITGGSGGGITDEGCIPGPTDSGEFEDCEGEGPPIGLDSELPPFARPDATDEIPPFVAPSPTPEEDTP